MVGVAKSDILTHLEACMIAIVHPLRTHYSIKCSPSPFTDGAAVTVRRGVHDEVLVAAGMVRLTTRNNTEGELQSLETPLLFTVRSCST